MKLIQKEIKLREKAISEILNNQGDKNIQNFIDEIKNNIEKINFFVDNIDYFSNYERYYFVQNFCKIVLEPKDYLRLLTMEYKEHYTNYINIKTYMTSENGDNIEYFGVTTRENAYLNNKSLSSKEIRKLLSNNKLLFLSTSFNKEKSLKRHEKFEKYPCLGIDINSQSINENCALFKYVLAIFKKEILKKEMLLKTRNYYYELMRQVKSITGLENSKKVELAIIGMRYKDAYNNAINDKNIPKVNRIIVSHKKNSIK